MPLTTFYQHNHRNSKGMSTRVLVYLTVELIRKLITNKYKVKYSKYIFEMDNTLQ